MQRLNTMLPKDKFKMLTILNKDDPALGEAETVRILEGLKGKARAAGLWNFFLPNAETGKGLSNLDYAFIAAGAVVTKDVPDYSLMMGIPAKRTGWISRHGVKLPPPDSNGVMVCPESGLRYKEVEPGKVRCLDLDENAPLPEDMRIGTQFYKSFK